MELKPVGQIETPVSNMSSDVLDFLETLDTKHSEEEDTDAVDFQELNFDD